MPKSLIYLVASGDFRPAALEASWHTQAAMEEQLIAAINKFGRKVVRAHPYDPVRRHRFLASQAGEKLAMSPKKSGILPFSEN
jgi:hypothetical protein